MLRGERKKKLNVLVYLPTITTAFKVIKELMRIYFQENLSVLELVNPDLALGERNLPGE